MSYKRIDVKQSGDICSVFMFWTLMSCFPLQTLTKLRLARNPLSNDEQKAFEVITESILYTDEVEKFVENEDREESK